MRHLFFFLVFLFSISTVQAQDDVNLSSIRIGPYKVGMLRSEAEKIAGAKLRLPTEANNYNDTNVVLYSGERIYLAANESYVSENDKREIVSRVWTRSSRFRTKSGLGVGSTRQQLLDAFGTYMKFSVEPAYDDNGKPIRNKSNFTLYDIDANTAITFQLIDNVVRQVVVFEYYGEECG